MIGTIIIALLVLLLTIFIYLSYKNEKKYKEEQEAKKEARKRQRPIIRKVEKRAPSTPPLTQKQTKPDIIPEEKIKTTPVAKPIEVVKKEVIPQPIAEKKEEKTSVLLPEYPAFDHSRLLEMGLSDDEAKEFVAELIPQITVQIPLIEASCKEEDFHAMERLTHSIKGSSTTVGTGGVSAVLVDFNTYLKHGTELPLIQAYIEQLKHYTEALQKQYA